jgi:hypothetical protein
MAKTSQITQYVVKLEGVCGSVDRFSTWEEGVGIPGLPPAAFFICNLKMRRFD